MEKSKSGMFIPLFYSNLHKSVREKEDIKYSVYYKVNDRNEYSTKILWHTHVLITTKGLYFGWYQKRKPARVKHVSWLAVKKTNRNTIRFKTSGYKLKPKRERNFETRKSFHERKKDISSNIKTLMRKGREINLSEISKQRELSKIRPKSERSVLQEILGDKWKEDYRIAEEAINLERKLRGEDSFKPTVDYVDIKKGKMKNQMNSIILDLTLIIVFLLPILVILRVAQINRLDFMGVYSFSFLIPYIGFIAYHRWRVRKKNLEIPQFEDYSWREGKKLLHYLEYKEKSMGRLMPRFFANFKSFNKGLKAYKIRNFEESITFLKPILDTEPKVVGVWYVLLECLYYLGEWEEMGRYGQEAIKINPTAGVIYVWLGEANKKLGKIEQAKNDFKEGIKLLELELMDDPKEDNLINMLGHVYLKLGNFEKGIKFNKEALKITPKSEHHSHGIGYAYRKLGDIHRAIKYLEMSLKFNPKHSHAWYDLGLIYEEKGELEKAIKHYEKAVEFSPQWVKLRERLFSIKPDSPALLITAPSVKDKKATKRSKEPDSYYDKFAERKDDKMQKYKERKEKQQQMFKEMRKERLQKYTKTITELLEMNVNEWEQYLEKSINGIERTIDTGLDYFEKKKSLQTHDIYLFLSLENKLEDRKNSLTNLRNNSNFITEIKERVEKDFESFKQREKERDFASGLPNIRKTLMNNLKKMNIDQYIKFLKLGVCIRQELIEREALKGGKTPFLVDLEKGLKQSIIDLNSLEKDPTYIDVIKKQFENYSADKS